MKNFIVDPKDNNIFLKLKPRDLQELLNQIYNFYLTYRSELELPSNLTFGVEIEYEGINKEITDKFIRENFFHWNSTCDGSLYSGGEIISPILIDQTLTWDNLKSICDFLKENRAIMNQNAGGHIHFGTNILGDNVKSWRLFLKTYMFYEGVLLRFLYGDKINRRKQLSRYASPIGDYIYSNLDSINHLKKVSDIVKCDDEGYELFNINIHRKYQAINFNNVDFYYPTTTRWKNTLEFRSPNASSNEIIWQNNVNTLGKLLVSSHDLALDEDFINYRIKHGYTSNNYNSNFLYDQLNIRNALEFVDLVFDNNLDKIYFLRQYLKDLCDVYNRKSAVLSRKFTR